MEYPGQHNYELLTSFDIAPVILLFTRDTSGYQEAHDLLVDLGCIPQPLFCSNARPIEERVNEPYLPWYNENCCILPVPGKEDLALNSMVEDLGGWGLYRVVFRQPVIPDESMKKLGIEYREPIVDFKYCFRHTPANDFDANIKLIKADIMKQAVLSVIPYLKVSMITDHLGNSIEL